MGAAALAAAGTPAPGSTERLVSGIVFEYVGGGSAAVRGAVSGVMYRFSGPGERLRVDPRDRPALMQLPALRWVR